MFTATFLFHHFLSEESWEWLANFKELKLTNEQSRALVFVREYGAINNGLYRDINQVDTLAASAALRQLKVLGLLESQGLASATHYVPTMKLLKPADKTHQLRLQTHQLGSETHQFDPETHQLIDLIEGEEAVKELPPVLKENLENLTKRSAEHVVREVILSLCDWQEMTPGELSRLMKRERKNLVRKYLTPMIKEGLLSYKFPQVPGHPNQAYYANKLAEDKSENQ